MPIYEYRCAKCGFQKEFLQRMSDAPLTECPECGKKQPSRSMVTAAGFQLKGTGWYATDFKNSGAKPVGEDHGRRRRGAKELRQGSLPASRHLTARNPTGKESSEPRNRPVRRGTPPAASTAIPSQRVAPQYRVEQRRHGYRPPHTRFTADACHEEKLRQALLHHRAPRLGAARDHRLGARRSWWARWTRRSAAAARAAPRILARRLHSRPGRAAHAARDLPDGLFAANIIGQRLVRYWERVLARIPVVNSIYNGVKQVSDTLFSPTRPGVPQGAARAMAEPRACGRSRS